jgi:hypothetical protein
MTMRHSLAGTALLASALLLASPPRALAHCDTLDGPVVKDARAALETREVTRVLRWVRAEQEAEVREAFRHALAVRALGPEARAFADRFFFETLVRIHRQGEGAAYTGLKPAGGDVDPAIAAADQALDTGAIDLLVRTTAARAEQGLRERFARATAAKPQVDESLAAGRAYVAAYVELVHYAERLSRAAAADARRPEQEAASAHAAPDAHRHER